jgi:hypothetical protein
MDAVAELINSQFVVALGDNFYSSGISSKEGNTSKRFDHTWKEVYDGKNLQTPWYLLAGNHDYKGDVNLQVEHTQIDPRWQFPSLYHSHSMTSQDGSVSLDLILIDTVSLASMNMQENESEPGYWDPLPLLSKTHTQEASDQWSWIEEKLAASKAQYLIVAGHYPVYSVCKHGSFETLLTHLQPLLEKYGAQAYLQGHDHCLEDIVHNDVSYIVSGMGDDCCYKAEHLDDGTVPEGALKFHVSLFQNEKHSTAGFVSVSLTSKEMRVLYHDQHGDVLFQSESKLPRKVVVEEMMK